MGKKGDGGTSAKLVTTMATAGGVLVLRKVLAIVWTKITGKEPPEHPEDPQVALSEALIWGIVLGAGVHTARMLATRATTRRLPDGDGPPV